MPTRLDDGRAGCAQWCDLLAEHPQHEVGLPVRAGLAQQGLEHRTCRGDGVRQFVPDLLHGSSHGEQFQDPGLEGRQSVLEFERLDPQAQATLAAGGNEQEPVRRP
jgi:hypothetical protein